VLRERRSSIDGVAMRWLASGDEPAADDQPPVVLVHGLPTGPLVWRHVAACLPRRRVLAWEMTGYAGSIAAGRDRDLSLAAQARRLQRWLAALEIDRVTLVGHDLGGGVAQILAVDQPDPIAALVLANAVAFDTWPVAPVRAARALSPILARLPDRLAAAALSAALRLGYADAAQARASTALHVAPYVAAGVGPALRAQIEALDAADTAAVAGALGSVTCPAAVVWGAGDPFLGPAAGRRLAAALGAPLLAVPRAGHFVPEEAPRAVVAAIERVESA
jgi:pimeloyl-ACP methyl ester carboxylesterase